MSKYFDTTTGTLTDSTDGVPDKTGITELSDLEYEMMRLRMNYNFELVYKALDLVDDLYCKIGAE